MVWPQKLLVCLDRLSCVGLRPRGRVREESPGRLFVMTGTVSRSAGVFPIG